MGSLEKIVHFEKMKGRVLQQCPYDKWVAISIKNPRNFAYDDSPTEASEKLREKTGCKEGKCLLIYNQEVDGIIYAA